MLCQKRLQAARHQKVIASKMGRLVPGIICCSWMALASACQAGTLSVSAIDENNQPVPFRIHLFNATLEAVKHPTLPFHHDHFVAPGQFEIDLPAGTYTFEVERGPEYKKREGEVTIPDEGTQTVELEIPRLYNMNQQGWYSGDLHIHRPVADVPLLIEAEGLNIAPVITWWNNKNQWADGLPEQRLHSFSANGTQHFYHVMAGEDERAGGALLYFGLEQPLPIQDAKWEHPSSLQFLNMVERNNSIHVDVEKPFWWDVPIWVASGMVDTIGIANNHMCRSKMYESEAWGFPRDEKRLPAPLGNGYWTQEIYYHLLNAGIHIPPSAGSASGVLPNPVGYNRVYVQVEGELTWQKWWDGLRAGRSFVTNGPLLLAKANGQLPGHAFNSKKELEISLEVTAFSQDELQEAELIYNGKVIQQFELNPDGKTKTEISFTCESNSWFLVRVLAKNQRTFRFASTAPFNVSLPGRNRPLSNDSTEFFIDWLEKRTAQVKENIEDPKQRGEVLAELKKFQTFWESRRDNPPKQ